ncbi:unnamed protein product [Cunninghamella blakesleeana]
MKMKMKNQSSFFILFLLLLLHHYYHQIEAFKLRDDNDDEKKNLCKKTKIAILGTGGSGIAAAVTLQEKWNQTDFLLIDAQSFIGGRLQHVSFGNKTIELGANWIYGKENNPIYELAIKHQLKMIPSDKQNVVYFDQSQGPVSQSDAEKIASLFDNTMNQLIQMADNRIKLGQVDLSTRTALKLLKWKPDTPLKAAIEYFGINWELAEGAEISSTEYASGIGSISSNPTNYFVVDPNGFNSIFKKEAERILLKNDQETIIDDRLLLNTLVKEIDYDNEDDQVIIRTEDGTKIIADFVICTFSLGVLQNQDLVQFKPEFPPWKQESLNAFHMATYTKIFVRFEEKFWDDWEFALYASNETKHGDDFTVWQALKGDDRDEDDNILLVTITHRESEKIEGKDKELVKQDIFQTLKYMYPNIKNTTILYPKDIFIPIWKHHPLFQGSYSNWPIGMNIQHHDNLRAPLPVPTSSSSSSSSSFKRKMDKTKIPRLFFTGEAHSQQYYGYLHGSYIEGINTANTIANCYLRNDNGIHPSSECLPYLYHPIVTGCTSNNNLNAYRRKLISLRHPLSTMNPSDELNHYQNQSPFSIHP